ncbi:COG4 transport protein-domain-containing protein [Entophlyctis helioformis]|nr:COG4 transport protein-domain-containing protein [Entophlyctis helioformis]
MRQGFTPDPRRVIPMGRGGRNILPGRDDIQAGLLPGPANVGFEFPASQSALQDLKLHADGLLTVIEKTWSVAQGISGKVRQLDLEQSRVKTTLQLLDDVQELKRAIARSDIETGADFIARFLRFNVEPVEEIFVHTMVMADDQDPGFMGISATDGSTSPGVDDPLGLMGPSPVKSLRHAQATLTNLLMDEFDAAVQANNPDEIVRCFKMFPQLGKAELGLDKFAAYVCGNISQFCHEGMRAATESNNRRNMYVDLITRLFEVIASMIDRQEAMVESHYGPGRMLSVIQRLQREADIQSSILIGGLMEARQLKRKVKDIQAYEDMTRRKHRGMRLCYAAGMHVGSASRMEMLHKASSITAMSLWNLVVFFSGRPLGGAKNSRVVPRSSKHIPASDSAMQTSHGTLAEEPSWSLSSQSDEPVAKLMMARALREMSSQDTLTRPEQNQTQEHSQDKRKPTHTGQQSDDALLVCTADVSTNTNSNPERLHVAVSRKRFRITRERQTAGHDALEIVYKDVASLCTARITPRDMRVLNEMFVDEACKMMLDEFEMDDE